MRRIITAVILIPLVLVAICHAPLWLLSLLLGLIAIAAIGEYLQIVAGHNLEPLRIPTFIIAGSYFMLSTISEAISPASKTWLNTSLTGQTLSYVIQLAVFIADFIGLLYLVVAMRTKPLSKFLPSAATAAFAMFYIALPLNQLLVVKHYFRVRGSLLVVYCLLVVWIGDIAALYVGRAFGRLLMARNISPKKTWEGAIASFVSSVLLGSLILVHNEGFANLFARLHLISKEDMSPFVSSHTLPNSWWLAILASASINVAAQIGDLVESAMKRGAEIKDSGWIIPGHGGVLDRIDALLFAAPVLWYYASSNLIHF